MSGETIMNNEDILSHVLKELECDDFFDILKKERVRSVRRLLSLTKEDLEIFVANDSPSFLRADMRSILEFMEWHQFYTIFFNLVPDCREFKASYLLDPEF